MKNHAVRETEVAEFGTTHAFEALHGDLARRLDEKRELVPNLGPGGLLDLPCEARDLRQDVRQEHHLGEAANRFNQNIKIL